MTDLEERILDLALDEVVGGRRPPDVSSRVLAELRRPAPALPNDRWRVLIMAAAATLFFGVLWVVVQQEDSSAKMEKLIEHLRSQNDVDREYGLWALKEAGKKAKPTLEKATIDKDPEIAKQARQLLRRLEILDILTPNLTKAFYKVEDRLSANEEAWLVVLREAVTRITVSRAKGETPGLGKEDLEALAGPAVRGAVTELQKQEACTIVLQHQLRSATRETAALLKDKAFMKAFAPELRRMCNDQLSQLLTLENQYARKFGQLSKETGEEFWRALTTSQPPMLDADSFLLTCPARFLAGAENGRSGHYWGPLRDANTLESGNGIGMCDDPLHGDFVIIMLKAGTSLTWARGTPMAQDARKGLKPPSGN